MTIQITGSVVADNARNGTLIGNFSVSTQHSGMLTYNLVGTNPNGYFVLSDKGQLFTGWIGSAIVDSYSIRIHAHSIDLDETADFVIRIVAAQDH